MTTVKVIVRGVDDLDAAFQDVRRDLLREVPPGFLPLHRFRGEGGVPFVSDVVEQVVRKRGFVTF